MTRVLLLGSAPYALEAREWPRRFDVILAINNAWRVRTDWDELIHPWDFPPERMPPRLAPGQRVVTETAFVPAQNAFGGFVYAGGTMAFTAAYYALYTHRPEVLALFGCDMIYPPSGPTHFYGTGAPDPLRADPTLQSLEAKSVRLLALAAHKGCRIVNLSSGPSRLLFPRAAPDLRQLPPPPTLDQTAIDAALAREDALGYRVPSGRYWDEIDRFDPSALADLDAMWRAALGP
ncbi:MAG: hypothetical protein KDE00_01990 [Rhodobacteraceae bacterium]|nr:hypothetical protein [Paracoccaceae bacterium]